MYDVVSDVTYKYFLPLYQRMHKSDVNFSRGVGTVGINCVASAKTGICRPLQINRVCRV